MRATLFLLPIVALTACATPREQCINDATRETRVLSALVAETEANIARGYALTTTQEIRTVSTTCEGRNEDGSTFLFPCEEVQTIDQTVPVAIDLNAEAAKLETLRTRLASERAAANATVSQCIATFPE